MPAGLADPPSLFERRPAHRVGEGHDDGEGRGPTLDGLLCAAWEGLAAHAVAACPVCGGDMLPRPAAGATAGGRCGDCGSSLS